MQLLQSALDSTFNATIKRNFRNCPVNPKFYFYSDNQEDSSSCSNSAQTAKNGRGEDTNGKESTVFEDYFKNLKGTSDAYSDTESDLPYYGSSKRANQPEESSDFKEVYSSCRNLLFEATCVVKDSSGSTVLSQPVNSLSQIFDLAMQKEDLVSSMVQKAKGQDRRNRERERQMRLLMHIDENTNGGAADGVA